MSTRAQKLRYEAKFTCTCLREAAEKLLAWAALQPGNTFPIPNEHLRDLAWALARQGGRLSMAADMSEPRRKA